MFFQSFSEISFVVSHDNRNSIQLCYLNSDYEMFPLVKGFSACASGAIVSFESCDHEASCFTSVFVFYYFDFSIDPRFHCEGHDGREGEVCGFSALSLVVHSLGCLVTQLL